MNFLSNIVVSISNGSHAKLDAVIYRIPQLNEFSSIFQILTVLQKQGVIRGFSYKKKINIQMKIVL